MIELVFALVWWIGLALIAGTLAVAGLAVYFHVTDRWR